MFFGLVTLFVALSISAVAAYYSIVGLMAIFSAAAFSIAVMGVVLEIGKLVTASWLYQNWKTVTLEDHCKILSLQEYNPFQSTLVFSKNF